MHPWPSGSLNPMAKNPYLFYLNKNVSDFNLSFLLFRYLYGIGSILFSIFLTSQIFTLTSWPADIFLSYPTRLIIYFHIKGH